MNEENIDYFSYSYEPTQNAEINGNALVMICHFLAEVIQKETEVFASFVYAKDIKEIKDADGKLLKIEYNWQEHNKDSFMMSAVDDGGSQLGLTPTGVKASQILSALLGVHAKNINSGLAKVKTELNDRTVFNT